MNIDFSKDAKKILRKGGQLFLTAYDSTKKLRPCMVGIVAKDAEIGDDLELEWTAGFPTSGDIMVGSTSEAYTAITGNVLTITDGLSAAVTAGAVVLVYTTESYAAIQHAGYLESVDFNDGIQEAQKVQDINGDYPAAFNNPDEPTFSVTLLQSGIDELALACGKDIEETPVNGLRMVNSSSSQLSYAGILVSPMEKGDGSGNTYQVLYMFNMRVNGSPSVRTVSTEARKLEVPFILLLGAKDSEYWAIGGE